MTKKLKAILAGIIALFILLGAADIFMIVQLTKNDGNFIERSHADGIFEVNNLPKIEKHSQTYMQSSFDRSGDNADASGFLYQDGLGKVFLEAQGPGVVNRIWVTGFSAGVDRIQIYFDGEDEPTIDLALATLFSGTAAPFTNPLVADETISSGGYTSYVPIYFNKSIKITGNGDHYYAIGYELFEPGVQVEQFTSQSQFEKAILQWNSCGVNPNGESEKKIADESTLAPSESKEVANIEGKNSIYSLQMKIDGVSVPNIEEVTDDGRYHRGVSSFDMKIDTANEGVKLIRRMNYSIGGQNAEVYADGQYVGDWYSPSFDPSFRWRDAEFEVPSLFTAGKSKVRFEIRHANSAQDWTEFYYTAKSKVAGEYVVSDELDVGKEESEQAHDYSITNYTYHGEKTFMYPLSIEQLKENILNNLYIHIYWDGMEKPSVSAPVGMFFGIGYYGLQFEVKTLLTGIIGDTFYMYFPMPFLRSAKVVLENKTSEAIKVKTDIGYGSFRLDENSDFGYFTTTFSHEKGAANNGKDLTFLDTKGSGNIVGIVYSPQSEHLNRSYFEGDERIYLDGSLTPQIHGTGMEDFFNGGWGFKFDQFSTPLASFTSHSKIGVLDRTSQIRLFVQDKIIYKTGAEFSIEHGSRNTIETEMWSLVYHYHREEAAMQLTDSIDIGNAEEEKSHSYKVDGEIWSGTSKYCYEGKNDLEVIQDTGKTLSGSSEMIFNIDNANEGVLLKRRMDFSISSQKAKVYVDGKYVGIWLTAGNNPITEWKDAWFMIPKSFTEGKKQIKVKIEFVSSGSDEWSEYRYDVYSLK